MQLVETFVSLGSEPYVYRSGLTKSTMMAMSSVAYLVENLAISPVSDGDQAQLALLLTRLCHLTQPEGLPSSVLDRRRRPSKVLDADLLRQNARKICENPEVLSRLQKDLQVRELRRCEV